MEPITRDLTLATVAGVAEEAQIDCWEEAPEDADQVKLVLRYRGESMEALSDRGLFHALQEIRRNLEPRALLVKCYGAAGNVYPSGMAASMGPGEKAYRLTLGQPARLADLVDIFDCDADLVPATVAEQELFYRQWLGSLPKPI